MDASIYRLRTTDVLVLCVLCLLALGVVMVQSASVSAAAGNWGWSLSGGGTKQLIFAALGFAAFLAVGRMDYRWICKPVSHWRHSAIFWVMGIAIFCNVVVLIPHVGLEINHSRRWLPLGPLTFEPSELAKWSVVLFLAYALAQRPFNLDRFFAGFVPMLAPVAVI